jgi:hypothetical protein
MLKWTTSPASRLRWRELVAVAVFCTLCLYFLAYDPQPTRYANVLDAPGYIDFNWTSHAAKEDAHRIDHLIQAALESHRSDLAKRTASVKEGAAAYRTRRKRHPPPGFDKWYENAVRDDAFIVEEFFDQIYDDLEPFWGVAPAEVRNSIAGWAYTISVRDGKVFDGPQDRHRSRTWGEMLREIAIGLPDLDIAINPYDEPRVIAPWSVVQSAMDKAVAARTSMMDLPVSTMSQQFTPRAPDQKHDQSSQNWISQGNAWDIFVTGCSNGHSGPTTSSNDETIFMSNWTASKDICQCPDMAKLHGALIEPATLSLTTALLPIFSTAKLSVNNDILLPPPSYYAEESLFSVKSWLGDATTRFSWTTKTNGLIWRGKATGGTTRENTWEQFHRHRFVSMLNGSDVDINFEKSATSGIRASERSQVADWLRNADVAFTDLFCGGQRSEEAVCQEMSHRYELLPEVKMSEQYRWKYLPDVDGNSLSGRFRAFLQSNSAPIKATIFKEWHDSRLTPWIHFIPVSISFRDLWEVMAYFLGFGDLPAHDEAGKDIAFAGRQWAGMALRREDMLLYMHRLLLEYARICDDQRDHLGFVADLTG